ncbi:MULTISPECIES: pentapeptide repeat-containing protein [Pseudofrankia]|uniref:pentapeptide repeat-containing protein n=1 Tax=Pseudofrankia TaxID=2994363 RepID=UPI001E5D89AD|nr:MULTISPECIES: pentapeptide repeat-containing protein [Pseudofrankia]
MAAGGLVTLWIIAPVLYLHTGGAKADARTAAAATTRLGIMTLAAGLIAFAGVTLNLRETRQANELTRKRDRDTHLRELDEQRTSRYTQAITQLGSVTLDIRLGGIYALARLAKDSPDDQPTVVEVLSAFVRTRSTDPGLRPLPPADGQDPPPRPAPDIRTAVQILARLPGLDDVPRADLDGADLAGPASLARLVLTNADLRNVVLSGADLTGARLDGANLTGATLGANLAYARLEGANLTGASLYGANLTGARLDGANLTGASLYGANLTGARLDGANLTGADLNRASLRVAKLHGANLTDAELGRTNLTDTELHGADLSGVRRLMQGQVDVALGDERTRLPEEPDKIVRPAGWPPPAPEEEV